MLSDARPVATARWIGALRPSPVEPSAPGALQRHPGLQLQQAAACGGSPPPKPTSLPPAPTTRWHGTIDRQRVAVAGHPDRPGRARHRPPPRRSRRRCASRRTGSRRISRPDRPLEVAAAGAPTAARSNSRQLAGEVARRAGRPRAASRGSLAGRGRPARRHGANRTAQTPSSSTATRQLTDRRSGHAPAHPAIVPPQPTDDDAAVPPSDRPDRTSAVARRRYPQGRTGR